MFKKIWHVLTDFLGNIIDNKILTNSSMNIYLKLLIYLENLPSSKGLFLMPNTEEIAGTIHKTQSGLHIHTKLKRKLQLCYLLMSTHSVTQRILSYI